MAEIAVEKGAKNALDKMTKAYDLLVACNMYECHDEASIKKFVKEKKDKCYEKKSSSSSPDWEKFCKMQKSLDEAQNMILDRMETLEDD